MLVVLTFQSNLLNISLQKYVKSNKPHQEIKKIYIIYII